MQKLLPKILCNIYSATKSSKSRKTKTKLFQQKSSHLNINECF